MAVCGFYISFFRCVEVKSFEIPHFENSVSGILLRRGRFCCYYIHSLIADVLMYKFEVVYFKQNLFRVFLVFISGQQYELFMPFI